MLFSNQFIFRLISIMQTQKVTSYCNRYKILKPNPQILLLRKIFQLKESQNYELAKVSDLAMRRYHRYCQNIQNLLPIAQWRLQAQQTIARCFYVQLGKPNLKKKSIQFQIYTEHIDLLIKDTNKLITAQSLYILVKSLQAYAVLLKKFQKVSVNSENFGLNVRGELIVWINRSLDLMVPEQESFFKENDVISCLIHIIREKSQFACKNILSSILQFSIKNNCKINEILSYIESFMTANKIKLADNLKYLVNRNKFLFDLKAIQNSNNLNSITKPNRNSQGTLQFSKKNKSKENNFVQKQVAKNDTKPSKKRLFRATTEMSETDVKQINSNKPKSFLSRLSSKGSQISNSFTNKVFKISYPLLKQKSIQESSTSQFYSRRNSFDPHNICIINKLNHLGSNLSIQDKGLFSRRNTKPINFLSNSQTPTTSSLLSTDKKLNHNSSLGRLSSKSKTVYKSFVNKFGSGLNKEVHEEKQSCQSSPEKTDKTTKELVPEKKISREMEISFGISSQKKNELILKENNWIKKIEGLLSIQSKLHNSIVQGSQKNEYLADVKLQMLDQLNAQMTQSLMPSTQLKLSQIPFTNYP